MSFLFQNRSARLRQKQNRTRNTNFVPYPVPGKHSTDTRNTNVAPDSEYCSAECLEIFPNDQEKREACVLKCTKLVGLSEPGDARSQLTQYYESETGQTIESNKAANTIIESEIHRRNHAIQEFEETKAKNFSTKEESDYLKTYTEQVINLTIAKLTEMFNVFGATGGRVAESMWGGEMVLSTGKQVVNLFKAFHNYVMRDPKMAHLTSIAVFIIRQEFCAWASSKLNYPTKAVYVPPQAAYVGEFRDLMLIEFLDDFIDKGMSPMMESLKDMMLAVFSAVGGAAVAIVKSTAKYVGVAATAGATAGVGAVGVGALAASGPVGWAVMAGAGVMYVGSEYLKTLGEGMVETLMMISRVVLKIMVRSFSDVAKNIVKVSHVLKTYNNIARLFTEPCRGTVHVWDPTGALIDDATELKENAQSNATQLYQSIADYSNKLFGGESEATEAQIDQANAIIQEISGPQTNYMLSMTNATPVDGSQAPETYEQPGWFWEKNTKTLHRVQ
jgi:hypothetical protein